MTWEDDDAALDAFDRLVINSWPDLNRFMTVTFENGLLGETPPELLVRIVANFWATYNSQRDIHQPIEALTMTKAIMMNDPVLHYLVQQQVGPAVEGVIDDEF